MKMIKAITVLITLFIMGCQMPVKPVTSELGTPFKGQVVYEQLEGGFWGIITDKGAKLDGPVPKEFQHNGLRVLGSYQALKDTTSFRMWGALVSFVKLEKESL